MLLQSRSPTHPSTFDFESVSRIARERALAPYQAASARLPADLQSLDYDGYRDIRFRPSRALWRDSQLPFEAMFFHLGQHQRQPVRVHEITPAGARPLKYQRGDFDFGKNELGPEAWGDLGFAGLRIHYPLNTPQYKDELIAFLGASYFRAVGAGQQYGLSARGLAIDTTGGNGEEFPALQRVLAAAAGRGRSAADALRAAGVAARDRCVPVRHRARRTERHTRAGSRVPAAGRGQTDRDPGHRAADEHVLLRREPAARRRLPSGGARLGRPADRHRARANGCGVRCRTRRGPSPTRSR